MVAANRRMSGARQDGAHARDPMPPLTLRRPLRIVRAASPFAAHAADRPLDIGRCRHRNVRPPARSHMEPLGDGMNGYPIQPAKVQRPPLRDETLARDRLLDWLAAKIHHRVILVLADAGYGKTTLLADFSRRTRLRTLWYRLDDDDRDWVSFLSHLVAAGREHDPAFAPTTAAMLSDLAMGGPTREAATEVFLRELPTIAEHGAVLILDDFHLVDESPDVRIIARELVARAPERLSIVFASRRTPTVPLARLRASARSPRSAPTTCASTRPRRRSSSPRRMGATLEPDVLADVAARTEGLGRVAPARPGGASGPIAGRDPAVRPRPDRRRPGALRLPRRGGRRRPAGRPPAVPDANVDPPGRHPRAGGGRRPASMRRDVARLTAAAERLTLLAAPRGAPARPAALPPARPRVPRGPAATVDRARPQSRRSIAASPTSPPTRLARRRLPLPRSRRHTPPSPRRSQARSPKSWAVASMPPPSNRSAASRGPTAPGSRPLVSPRRDAARATSTAAIAASQAVLEAVDTGSRAERLRVTESGDRLPTCRPRRGDSRLVARPFADDRHPSEQHSSSSPMATSAS